MRDRSVEEHSSRTSPHWSLLTERRRAPQTVDLLEQRAQTREVVGESAEAGTQIELREVADERAGRFGDRARELGGSLGGRFAEPGASQDAQEAQVGERSVFGVGFSLAGVAQHALFAEPLPQR